MHIDTIIRYGRYTYDVIDNFTEVPNSELAVNDNTAFYIADDIDKPFLEWCDRLDRRKKPYAIVEAKLTQKDKFGKLLSGPKLFYVIVIQDKYGEKLRTRIDILRGLKTRKSTDILFDPYWAGGYSNIGNF